MPFICAPEVHAQGITGKGVTVAVIDTGVDYNEGVPYCRIVVDDGRGASGFPLRFPFLFDFPQK